MRRSAPCPTERCADARRIRAAGDTGSPHFRTPADIMCYRARCPICSPRRSLIIPRAPRKAKSAENVKFSVTVDSPQLSCRPIFPRRLAFAFGTAFCPCRAAYAAAPFSRPRVPPQKQSASLSRAFRDTDLYNPEGSASPKARPRFPCASSRSPRYLKDTDAR